MVGVDPASPHPIGTLLILVRGGLVLGGILGNDPVLSLAPLSFDSGEGRRLDAAVKIHSVTFFYNHK